jgi:hypothetical protein
VNAFKVQVGDARRVSAESGRRPALPVSANQSKNRPNYWFERSNSTSVGSDVHREWSLPTQGTAHHTLATYIISI